MNFSCHSFKISIYIFDFQENERAMPSRETLGLSLPSAINAPPIPQRENRPKSQGFSNLFCEVHTPTRGPFEYNSSSLPSFKSR